jgi:aminopeptidase
MFTPSDTILRSYARVLVSFALGGGKGVQPGEFVHIVLPESAKPLYVPLRDAVREAGAMMHLTYIPDGIDNADYISKLSDGQLTFFPAPLYKGMVESFDHQIGILAEDNPRELQNVDPARMMKRQQSLLPYRQWRDSKEAQGKFTWTLALYGTPAMAAEAGLSLEEYWQQIISACYLDTPDPVRAWQEVAHSLEETRATLSNMGIEWLNIEAPGTHLRVKLGEGRRWLGGSGRNIPSFELFTSPDYRHTEGVVTFTEPLYVSGSLVRDVSLTFAQGEVVSWSASEGASVLEAMLAVPGATRVGEFSLTDGSMSRITKFMATTLYDENRGGDQGNMHLALGNAYREAYTGDQSLLSEAEWSALGYNTSAVHTDIVATSPRVVMAELADGSTRCIYKDGHFTLD